MSIDKIAGKRNGRSGANSDLTVTETFIESEIEHIYEATILTTSKKSKIKIIKNSDCKSWTYHKGDLLS